MIRALLILFVILALILISLINVFLRCNFKSENKAFFIVDNSKRFIEYSIRKFAKSNPTCEIIFAIDNCNNEQLGICKLLAKDFDRIRLIDIKEIDNYY